MGSDSPIRFAIPIRGNAKHSNKLPTFIVYTTNIVEGSPFGVMQNTPINYQHLSFTLQISLRVPHSGLALICVGGYPERGNAKHSNILSTFIVYTTNIVDGFGFTDPLRDPHSG
jgi:hypothetical protein